MGAAHHHPLGRDVWQSRGLDAAPFFKRIGWDPALMSNPFVAGIIDIVGIVIYMNVAWLLLREPLN